MEHKICVLIIDSETESVNYLKEILEQNSSISSIDYAEDSDQALLKVIDSTPDIVFIHYPSKGKAVAEFLKFIQTKLTETTIVFVSESKESAIHAIRNGVFHYLLKPIQNEELYKIIDKVQQTKQNNVQFKIKRIIEKSTEEKRLLLQTSKGYILIDPEEILYFMADGILTEMHLTQNRMEIIYLFLSKVEELVESVDFMRASRKYLINKKYIRKVIKSNNSIVLSHDGKEYIVKGSKQHIRNLTKFNTE
jgi:DNA-binding LytR/AlgR family response regulator